MVELLVYMFGTNIAVQLIIIGAYYIEQLFCSVFFVWNLKRRKFFLLRIIITVIICTGICILLAYFRNSIKDSPIAVLIFCHILIFTIQTMLIFGLIAICFDEKLPTIIMCACAISAATQIVSKAYGLLLNAFGIDDRVSFSFFTDINNTRDWALYWAIHAVMYIIVGLIFGERKKVREHTDIPSNVVALSALLAMLTNSLFTVSRNFESQSFALMIMTKLFSLILCVVILLLRTGLLSREKAIQELGLMDELLRQQRKQYEAVKSNIEIINIKCHDLKRELNKFEDKLTESELNSLKSAIEIYDSNIHTGNEILDVILYENKLYCENNGISLSCIADGNALSFMSATHLYSLFGNAITNAIEAVSKVENPEKRVISITVEKSVSDKSVPAVAICLTNYFNGNLNISNGTLYTSKTDTNRHGYGIKSMRYIIEQYNGKLTFETENDIFFLKIIFNLP